MPGRVQDVEAIFSSFLLLRWTSTSFSYYNKRVEIHASARKHGVADQDILHAIDHALALEDAGEDPDRWLLIGPDTAEICSRS